MLRVLIFSGYLLATLSACVRLPQNHVTNSSADLLEDGELPFVGFGIGKGSRSPVPVGIELACTSRAQFGDWIFRESIDGITETVTWYRFSEFEGLPCWASVARAGTREALDTAHTSWVIFRSMGTTTIAGEIREVWVIQFGPQPETEYIFLTREPDGGVARSFTVSPTKCARAESQNADPVAQAFKRYCFARSPNDVFRLAVRMAREPAVGRLLLAQD